MRRSRWVVIRNTFPELKSTTIKTWLDWFPEQIFGTVKWGSPITHTIKRGDLELEVIFMALDRAQDVKKLLSLELTGGWVNECREVPKAIVDGLTGRVGRYPARRDGGASWFGVIMDTNMPDDDHWLYRLAEEEQPEGWAFFKQPSGLSPEAENVENLPPGYYQRLMAGKSKEWIRVYVEAKYGSILDGRPVYPEYNDSIHCASNTLKAYRGIPLVLGFDFGLTPACTISQLTPRGQLRTLDEQVAWDMGIRRFAKDVLKPFLHTYYRGMRVQAWADPGGNVRSQTDESTCLDILREEGIPVDPTHTNANEPRKDALRSFMTKMVDGEPGFLVSPTCKVLRKGLNGGYHYERLQVAGDERFKDYPCKNKFSHIVESLEYAALGCTGETRSARRRVPPPARYSPAEIGAGY